MSEKVLFISGRCPHSKKILIGIQKYDFLRSLFKIINIDTQPYPNYIKSVPSLIINGQIITGETIFQYLGKLVEGKQQQEERIKENKLNESDQGQCRINEDGELEGWCSPGGITGGIGFSLISEENDDYTKKNYKIDTNFEFIDGSSGASIQQQVQQMEKADNQLSQKNKQFDNDYERLQRERGEIGNGMPRR